MPKKAKGQAEVVRWMGPLLDCLRSVGGSAKPKEVSAWIARELKLTPEVTEPIVKSGANRFHNQVQWARQYLVWQGLIDDAKRGVWTLTPLGWKARPDEAAAREIFLERAKINQALRKAAAPETNTLEAEPDQAELLPRRRIGRAKSAQRPQDLVTVRF